MTASPSSASSSVANRTEVNGNLSSTTDIAPMPMAAPATSGNPGRWDSAIPPAAPRNIAGNTGPPRKLASDTP
jgi:hypothetical protein